MKTQKELISDMIDNMTYHTRDGLKGTRYEFHGELCMCVDCLN